MGSRIFRFLILVFITGEIGHGAYFCFKQIVIKKNFGVNIVGDGIYFKTMRLVSVESAKNKKLVMCSNAQKLANICNLEGISAYYEPGKLKVPVPTSNPLTFIIAIDKGVPGFEAPILLAKGKTPDFIIQGVYYYIVHVPKTIEY